MTVKVCLVTSGHLSTNPRLVKEADALTAAGYEVHIVATKFIAWADAADLEFVERPWHVTTVRFGLLAHSIPGFYLRLRRHLARQAVKMFGFRIALVKRAIHWVIPELTRAACKVQAELYIAHNLAALPAAIQAAEKNKARVVFDAEDFHSGELSDEPANEFDRQLVVALESHYLSKCDAMTAASPGIARAYAEAYKLAVPTVILNVFPKLQAPTQPNQKGITEPGPSIYWFSQTIGPDRGLETAIEAIALATCRPHLYLRGNLSDAYRSILVTMASERGVLDHLHFLSPGLPSNMIKMAAEYDAGLASEPGHSLNNRLACSNKLFTYLLAGLPTIASSTPAQSEFSGTAAAAVSLYDSHDAMALADRMDKLLLDPERLANARLAAWNLGQEKFNWEVESKAWLLRIEQLFGRSDSRESAHDKHTW